MIGDTTVTTTADVERRYVLEEPRKLEVSGLIKRFGATRRTAGTVAIDGIDLARSPIIGSDSDRRVPVDHLAAEGPEVPARDDGSAVVQPEPQTVSITAAACEGPAWALPAVPFGAQLLRGATVAASYGERNVCSHCGVVQGVRPVDAADPLASLAHGDQKFFQVGVGLLQCHDGTPEKV